MPYLLALPWRMIGLASLGLFVAGLMLALKIERVQNDKLKTQVERQAGVLRDLARQSRIQKDATKANIDKAEKQIVYVDRVVEKLVNRPLPENCQTPDKGEWGNVV